jgi:YVTN family beta-propeller protein
MIATLALLTLLAKPNGIAVIVNQQSDTASIVDLATRKTTHVPVGGGPHESAVSPSGSRAVVTNYFKPGVGPGSSLSVLDLASKKELKRIQLDRQAMPHGVQWVDDQKVVCTDERNQRLLLVDVDAGKVEREFVTGQGGSHMLSLNLKANRLVSSNMGGGSVTIFDFKSGERLETVTTGKECEGVGIAPDGKTIWAGNRAEDTISVIDVATRKVVKKIESKGFPYRVQFTPNGKWALIPHAMSGELVVCDVETMTVAKRIKVQSLPSPHSSASGHQVTGHQVPLRSPDPSASGHQVTGHQVTPLRSPVTPSPAGVWPCADSKTALVTLRNDNSVVIVDLLTGETLSRFQVQESPDGVSMKPGSL